ncbi:MAG: fatty acid--CoA ligase family protein, partial [Desulfobacterales bacterium]|nr:fatty acid--CoA ligase family protein [Desulfobacterales bacterium]
YAMAAYLRAYFRSTADSSLVCLCAEDKAVVAAALLASLAGGPATILPYASSPQVLAELQGLTGFRHAVVDGPKAMPAGVCCVEPKAEEWTWPSRDELSPLTAASEWVRLFTGGSTGTPKMWTKTVRNLLAETISIITNYGVSAEDRFVATVSPNHIYGLLYSILTPLLATASVTAQRPSFPGEIETAVSQDSASVLISVPAHFRALNGHPFAPSSLRLAFSSAGMLAAEDAEAFTAQTGVGITEIYGSTETGGIASRVRARGETDFTPYDAVAVRIEDQCLKVRSDYLSPSLGVQAGDYFSVGDHAAPKDGNRFELLGRSDGIVKVGGQRVDLAAVRETLKALPGVNDAVAISLPVGRGRENRIVAVLEGDLDAAELNEALQDSLEPYARPRSIQVVAKIPVTAAGKYDRQAIAAMFQIGKDRHAPG